MPPKRVVITLDDGYRDNLENAAPILEEAGFTATIFLVTDRAGGVNEWDLKHGDRPRPLLDWAEVRRLDGGVFRFEPHSRTHPELTTVDRDRARDEITGAKRAMEDQLGRSVTVFSYPHGSFHLGLETLVREAGYAGAVTDLQGLNRRGTDPFRIRRTMITSRDFLAPYAFKVVTGFGVMGLGREMARRAIARPAAWERPGFA
jgi:peptidoglycan/xylan/chitin deacetylase (PgdA/CDA1 family)